MYCIKCGVGLADSEKSCPLCGTRVYHPDLEIPEGEALYPRDAEPAKRANRWRIMLMLTLIYLLPMSICLVSDLQLGNTVSWSGYVIGAMLVFYVAVALPNWFYRPNPVIFVPVTFAAIALYLLYIDLITGGGWFLSFAFPVTGAVCLLVTAVVTLTRYIRKGRLYIFGGAVIALGAFMPLLEHLLHITFGLPGFGTWSWYPLITLTVLGLLMILTAILGPMREALEKKLFI